MGHVGGVRALKRGPERRPAPGWCCCRVATDGRDPVDACPRRGCSTRSSYVGVARRQSQSTSTSSTGSLLIDWAASAGDCSCQFQFKDFAVGPREDPSTFPRVARRGRGRRRQSTREPNAQLLAGAGRPRGGGRRRTLVAHVVASNRGRSRGHPVRWLADAMITLITDSHTRRSDVVRPS